MKAEERMLHVLQHALGRDQYGRSGSRSGEDYRNHFCTSPGGGDWTVCEDATSRGLMVKHPPRAISGGDHIFTVTDAGKEYIAANSPAPPRVTRAARRYQAYLDSAAGEVMSFRAWLRGGRA